MADAIQLDPVDRTRADVPDAMLKSHTPYKFDECIPCGMVIRMGFFFDGFGRNRDHDDPLTSRYSNICRLWEAHRDNLDSRRQTIPNELWYPFYYSGLGTELNKDAENNEIVSASVRVTNAVGNAIARKAESTAEEVVGVDRLLNLKRAPAKAAKSVIADSLHDLSFRPIAKTYRDLLAQAKRAPANVGRVLAFAKGDRWMRRVEAVGRGTLYDLKKSPLKGAATFARSVFVDTALDSIPMLRDNAAVARVFGTGVEVRLDAASNQFEDAYQDAKAVMHKVQRIEVSVFGADRGCVLARAFVNELVRLYKQPDVDDLAIEGHPIEIKFLGLLDGVSSLMEENKLMSFVPALRLLKQNYADQRLDVPAQVRKCVHFAAAHELRFYQRLDSLENTRGDQYLYPGTSEDITGGAPAGSMGFRAELQRVALRDMLSEALKAGAAVDLMESIAKYKTDTFRKFTLAQPISDGETSYKIPELVAAYRSLVPYVKGLNFLDHMQVFLRWLAVRYQSPEFRESITSKTDEMKHIHQALRQKRIDAEAAYLAERDRRPTDSLAFNRAEARLLDARYAENMELRDTITELARPVVSVWERLESEAREQTERASRQASLKNSPPRIRTPDVGVFPPGLGTSADLVEETTMSPEQIALVEAWKDGLSGRNPLPPKVMAFFDLLVHDTMLTSWHDHILASPLYFKIRATDTFGETDFKDEAREHGSDERYMALVDRMSEVGDARAGTGLDTNPQ